MNELSTERPGPSLAPSVPLFLLLAILVAGANFFGARTSIQARSGTSASVRNSEIGEASYYGEKYHGRPTASGELFDMNQLTAAHPDYSFGTRVKVTNQANNRFVVVRINDRGPFVKGRIIDLSLAAARELDMVESGVATVKLEVVPP